MSYWVIIHFKTHRKKYFLKIINLAATSKLTILKNMGEGLNYKSSIMDSFQIMYNLRGECLVYINGTAITLFLSI